MDKQGLTLKTIELLEQGLQTSHTVGILVVLSNQLEVMTDVGHLVEQEQSLLVTLTDAVEILRQRVVILQQTLLLVDTFLIVLQQLLLILACFLADFICRNRATANAPTTIANTMTRISILLSLSSVQPS